MTTGLFIIPPLSVSHNGAEIGGGLCAQPILGTPILPPTRTFVLTKDHFLSKKDMRRVSSGGSQQTAATARPPWFCLGSPAILQGKGRDLAAPFPLLLWRPLQV